MLSAAVTSTAGDHFGANSSRPLSTNERSIANLFTGRNISDGIKFYIHNSTSCIWILICASNVLQVPYLTSGMCMCNGPVTFLECNGLHVLNIGSNRDIVIVVVIIFGQLFVN